LCLRCAFVRVAPARWLGTPQRCWMRLRALLAVHGVCLWVLGLLARDLRVGVGVGVGVGAGVRVRGCGLGHVHCLPVSVPVCVFVLVPVRLRACGCLCICGCVCVPVSVHAESDGSWRPEMDGPQSCPLARGCPSPTRRSSGRCGWGRRSGGWVDAGVVPTCSGPCYARPSLARQVCSQAELAWPRGLDAAWLCLACEFPSLACCRLFDRGCASCAPICMPYYYHRVVWRGPATALVLGVLFMVCNGGYATAESLFCV
jgi:hypothetical protein